MPYIVDRSLPTKDLVLGLINHDNGTNFTAEQVLVGDTPESIWLNQRNTRISITETMGISDVPQGMVYYNRMNIASLFTIVKINVREVDISADGSIDANLVFLEIERKYQLRTTDGFEIVKSGETYLFKALSDNIAYVGEVPLIIETSLQTRVAIRELDGFDTIKNIATVITTTALGDVGTAPNGYDPEVLTQSVEWDVVFSDGHMFRLDDNGNYVFWDISVAYIVGESAGMDYLKIANEQFTRASTVGTEYESTHNVVYTQIGRLPNAISPMVFYVNESI